MTMPQVLGRYDAAAVRALLEEAGVLRVLALKGFGAFEVIIETAGLALPHTMLYGRKDGGRRLLLDACLGEAVVRPDFFVRRGHAIDRPIDMAVVHWVREEDPTVAFPTDRPRLPLQQHPGLGVLRRAFRVIVRMAGELGKDGVASVPKLFHDAVIFYRSRLFLFLDGAEQGRFEALARDLRGLALGDASLAIAGGAVHAADGSVIHWTPGYQVFPISERLAAYFHSPSFAGAVAESGRASHFTWDPDGLTRTRALVET